MEVRAWLYVPEINTCYPQIRLVRTKSRKFEAVSKLVDKITGAFYLLMWPPLWSSGQSSWLQIQRSVFDSRHYQVFWEAVGLERFLLSLVSTTEELLGRKSSVFSLESREYGRMDQTRWPRKTLYSQKLALTSPTSGGLSVGIVR
jgi:hypothetical protein